jgi:succinyl-diaminopimelate desuccinylase
MPANDDVIQLLCDLIALPSVNPDHNTERTESPYGEGRVADYVQSYFQPFEVRVERQQALPGRDNVLVHVPGADRAARPVLLEAHMDTVDVQGMEDPFTPRVEGGRIYGRGACDTKASLAAMMRALRELLEEGASLPRGCVLGATADEEFGMAGARQLVRSEMAFVGAIVGEPTCVKVVAAHDGQMYVKIIAHGKAAHTSSPQYGVNAIYAINEAIGILRQRADTAYRQRLHPLCGSPKLTVSMIHGGASEHIVPDLCEMVIDCRVIPGETCQQVLEEVKSWLAEGLDGDAFERLEFAVPHKAEPPVETPLNHPLVKGLREAAVHVLGDGQVVGVPYNTDASHYAAAGIPCVVFGPAGIAQAHGVVEFVEIEQLTAAVEILKHFLLEGAGALD